MFESFFFRFGWGETGIQFAGTLFSTGIVWVSYIIIKDMFNKKLALLVAISLTFSWISLFFIGRLLTNIPATFFLLTSLMFFWKGYVLKKGNKFIYLFGLFFALTSLTRMQYLMFAFPLVVFLFTKEKFKFLLNKHLWIAAEIFVLIFIPQMVMHYQHFGNPLIDLSSYYFGIGESPTGELGAEGSESKPLAYFLNLPYILDGNQKGYSNLLVFSPMYILFVIGAFMLFIEMILGIDQIFKNDRIQKIFFIFLWIIFTFFILGYKLAPQLEQRHIDQTLPFLFLIATYPLMNLIKISRDKFNIGEKNAFLIVIFLLFLLIIPNILFGNNLIDAKKTSYLEVKQAGLWIKDHSNPEDIVISDSLPQITYYSERSTYPFNLAYRRDITRQNESALLDFISSNKPKFMTLTAFERQDDWAIAFPQNHPEMVVPVQVYKQNEQPVFVIYQFNYNSS